MIRGTTAQFKFKLPYAYDAITNITIKFWQPGNPNESLPIFKYKQDCVALNSNEIYVSLRPSETALFSDKYKAKFQLSARPEIGSLFGSKEHLITVYPMPDDIMLDDPTVDPDVPLDAEWILLDGNTVMN